MLVLATRWPQSSELANRDQEFATHFSPALCSSASAEVALLRNSSGVRTIIALGHSGLPTDRRIAAECPGVDIVIGAHDDTFLWNVDMAAPPAEDAERVAGPYPLVVEQPGTGKRVPVVQAYRHTKYVGHLRVRIAADGTVRSFDGQPLLMDGQVPRDPEALALLQRFRPAMREVADRPVGESMVRLDGTCASVETNAGNLVCDALLHANAMAFDAARKAETAAPPNGNETMAAVDRWTDCAVVFFQTSAIAPFGIKAGKLTMGDLMMLLPYDSRFYSVWLSGREILQMLEHSVERYCVLEGCAALALSDRRITIIFQNTVFAQVHEAPHLSQRVPANVRRSGRLQCLTARRAARPAGGLDVHRLRAAALRAAATISRVQVHRVRSHEPWRRRLRDVARQALFQLHRYGVGSGGKVFGAEETRVSGD